MEVETSSYYAVVQTTSDCHWERRSPWQAASQIDQRQEPQETEEVQRNSVEQTAYVTRVAEFGGILRAMRGLDPDRGGTDGAWYAGTPNAVGATVEEASSDASEMRGVGCAVAVDGGLDLVYPMPEAAAMKGCTEASRFFRIQCAGLGQKRFAVSEHPVVEWKVIRRRAWVRVDFASWTLEVGVESCVALGSAAVERSGLECAEVAACLATMTAAVIVTCAHPLRKCCFGRE